MLAEVLDSSKPVAWADVAGLSTAKTALQEAVIYPALRPDIYMVRVHASAVSAASTADAAAALPSLGDF